MPIERNQRPRSGAPRRRRGVTLVELVAAMTVAAIVCAVALPVVVGVVDRIVVRSAVDAISAACALARGAAIMRGTSAVVTFDTVAVAVRVTVGGELILDRPLDPGGALRLQVSRDRVTYASTGLGYGASNTRVLATRRAAADTLYASRLGRIRH
jgi:prepilin-type N-terminal cleavage/methylation domain-containing protein